jgi:hypothetical protein
MSTRRLDYDVDFKTEDIKWLPGALAVVDATFNGDGSTYTDEIFNTAVAQYFDEEFEGEVVRQALYKYVMDYGIPASESFTTTMHFGDSVDDEGIWAMDEETYYQGGGLSKDMVEFGTVSVIVSQVDYTVH